MTIEEITQTLQRVADNQAKHDEMHARHTADIAEIDRMIAANLESQSRYDRQLARVFDALENLADRQLQNENLCAEIAKANELAAKRIDKLEGSYDLLEAFVRSVREETHDYFAETDVKLARLADVYARTAELVAEFVKKTNERFKETNGRFAETDKRLAEFVSETDRRFSILERNGSTARLRARAKKSKKSSKKKGAK